MCLTYSHFHIPKNCNYTKPIKGLQSYGVNYRFAFNGKEKIDEINGVGNDYDYGFRIYNARIGKFLSVDPLTRSYPWYTPYQFAGNRPIAAIDLDGLEEVIINEYRIFGVTWLRTYDYVEASKRTDNTPGTYVLIERGPIYKSYHRNENGKTTNWGGNTINPISGITDSRMLNGASYALQSKLGGVQMSVPSRANVSFETNSSTVKDAVANLTPENKSALQKYAVTLLKFPEIGLDVQGYTDAQGNNSLNQKLSENRANAVKSYIMEYLASNKVGQDELNSISNRIFTKGNGAINDGSTDNPSNRKVDVTIVKSDGSQFTPEEKGAVVKPYSGD
jgi:RHS repeat-associated protein